MLMLFVPYFVNFIIFLYFSMADAIALRNKNQIPTKKEGQSILQFSEEGSQKPRRGGVQVQQGFNDTFGIPLKNNISLMAWKVVWATRRFPIPCSCPTFNLGRVFFYPSCSSGYLQVPILLHSILLLLYITSREPARYA